MHSWEILRIPRNSQRTGNSVRKGTTPTAAIVPLASNVVVANASAFGLLAPVRRITVVNICRFWDNRVSTI